MNARTFLGAILLVIGLFAAIATIIGVGSEDRPQTQVSPVGEERVVGDQNAPDRAESASFLLPVIAGFALAGGAFLVGIGMGNFRRPKIVSPHSPQESRAETTRPLH